MATYRELGERLGVDVCTGCFGFDAKDHAKGKWAGDGRFHYSERALRRTSIRNFVWRIAAQMRPTGSPADPQWLRYWNRVEWAKWALRELHVRLPAPAWDTQRATLRALLAAPTRELFFDDVFAEKRSAARKASIRWAKKPVEQGPVAEYDA